MSGYKKILYVDRYEDGVKVSNAGFARMMRKEKYSLQVHISDPVMKGVWSGNVTLQMRNNDFSLGRMELFDGKGVFRIEDLEKTLREANAGEGNAMLELRIAVDGVLYLCKLNVLADILPEGEMDIWQENTLAEKECTENRERDLEKEEISEDHMTALAGHEVSIAEEILRKTQEVSEKMCVDKWRQLLEIYPAICPFSDNRRYLRLDLQDLIILPKQYYRLVENSFLLHGYHNYRHLVLARVCVRGIEKYYVGVPGNYYEKETRVAVMFGFESFEPETERPKEGDFGYYMIGVDI